MPIIESVIGSGTVDRAKMSDWKFVSVAPPL
jgi:hypothetical protein